MRALPFESFGRSGGGGVATGSCLPNRKHPGLPNGRSLFVPDRSGELVPQQRDGRRTPTAPGGSHAGRESPARSTLGVEEKQLPLAFRCAWRTGQILLWQADRAGLLVVPGASPPRLHEGSHERISPPLGQLRVARHDPLVLSRTVSAAVTISFTSCGRITFGSRCRSSSASQSTASWHRNLAYSITISASAMSDIGTSRPCALAVWRLIANSNFVGF